ncbi:probable disease resistance protein At4g19060 [Syzygium oleosum]|uniref:probable disease resistance protein At4g19060 n=1 Tax=Syzygium oleosum TaxID=219896 RepID=UPI0011D1C819|nr:probable disease resistance protein At4g19060 [Syzygium oleosum]
MAFLLRRRQPENPAINEADRVEPTDGSLGQSEVFGRKVEVPFLVHDLIANSESNYNQFMALGIVGAAGSGKTTICQMIFDSADVRKHFLPRIWVCMTKQPSDDPDPKLAVAKRMLTCLGEDEEIIEEKKREKDGVSGLVSLLHRQLVGKRYLIVLDDAWDTDEWYHKLDLGFDYSIQQHKPNKGKNVACVHSTDWSRSLAFGLPKGYGGAVIVNGGSNKLVEMMVGKENLHHLLPLEEEDCWAIFKNAAGVDPALDPQVEEFRGIVRQGAGGHPFLAKLMGQCHRDMMQSQPQTEDAAPRQAADDSGGVTTNQPNPSTTLGSSQVKLPFRWSRSKTKGFFGLSRSDTMGS